MTKEELIDCLGTIAQSGTSKFLTALKVSISSQFGMQLDMPFYSLESGN